MAKRAAPQPQYINMTLLIRIVVLGLLIYLLAAGIGGLTRSISAVAHARPLYILLAILVIAVSYVMAAVTYRCISPKRVPLGGALCIQLAGGLVNRLLPAGIGGIGINALFLKKQGLTLPVAAAVVSMNTVLGFVGNAVLVGLCIWLGRLTAVSISLPEVPLLPLVLVAGAACIAILLAVLRKHLATKFKLGLFDALSYARRSTLHPARLFMGLGSSMALTSLHALGLYLVLISIGAPGSLTIALVAISAGAAAGAAVPTPGGLGGAEAGIAAALVAFGVPTDQAIAAALVYRGITYWLPLLPGYIAYRVAEKRYI